MLRYALTGVRNSKIHQTIIHPMKQYVFKKSMLLLLGSLMVMSVQASSLMIVDFTGKEKPVEAGSLRALTFAGTTLNIRYQDGKSESISLDSIRKIYFAQPAALQKPTQAVRVVLFPNPVTEELQLRNLPEGAWSVSIWDISGRKVLQQSVTATAASLSVGQLPSGLYLLRVNNQTYRFSKR